MSVSITLPNDLEEFLQREAARQGVPLFSERETQLLLKIQNAFPVEQTRLWHQLRDRGEAETLTPEEREHLLRLNEERDLLNANRLEALGEFAQLRGVSVRELMQQLGIRPE
jgi:hypothetical protein